MLGIIWGYRMQINLVDTNKLSTEAFSCDHNIV